MLIKYFCRTFCFCFCFAINYSYFIVSKHAVKKIFKKSAKFFLKILGFLYCKKPGKETLIKDVADFVKNISISLE